MRHHTDASLDDSEYEESRTAHQTHRERPYGQAKRYTPEPTELGLLLPVC